ncbi:MAG: DUF4421 family protein [Bacteroidales bacterium]|nr:DUF4421 family protein [Bacteroidales bacterium]
MRRAVFIRILAAVVLSGASAATPASAQSLEDAVWWLWDFFSAPSRKLDPSYVFQPRNCFSVSTDYSVAGNRVVIDSNEEIYSGPLHLNFGVDLKTEPRVTHKIGFSAGYGPLKLGFSHEVGRKSRIAKDYSLRWFTNTFAIDARYDRYYSKPEGTMSVEFLEPSDPMYMEQNGTAPLVSTGAAKVKDILLSGVYAFNQDRFSYRAAYNGGVVQRRSAGSLLAAAKYARGDISLDPNDAVLMNMIMGMGSFSSRQFSLGVGYSYNWVPFHRDASRKSDLDGLRNLTLNITAVPMLAVRNKVITTEYSTSGIFGYTGEAAETFHMRGRVQPSFTARSGLSYTSGHFYLTSWVDFSLFAFNNGSREYPGKSGDLSILSQRGSFSSWTAVFQLNYRF